MKASNNWKQQLRNRQITPSDEAWLAIEAGLEKKSKNKLKKTYLIALIAACCIGFIVFISLPPTYESTTIAEVESPSTEIQKSVFPDALFITTYAKKPFQKREKVVQKQTDHIPSARTSNSIATKIIEEESTSGQTDSTTISSKASKLLAEVETEIAFSEHDLAINADAEVEQLLAQAQMSILKTEYNQLYDYALSANLLTEVERDLSKNKLQDKVWQFVKNNVQNLESAITSLR